MAKGFLKNNPLDTLSNSGVSKNTVLSEPSKNSIPAADEETLLEPDKNKNKKRQKYLRLDITDYQDYVSLMAEHSTNASGKYVSMTQYILRLIEADKQKNIELY